MSFISVSSFSRKADVRAYSMWAVLEFPQGFSFLFVVDYYIVVKENPTCFTGFGKSYPQKVTPSLDKSRSVKVGFLL